VAASNSFPRTCATAGRQGGPSKHEVGAEQDRAEENGLVPWRP
jgi:hypothetical protein